MTTRSGLLIAAFFKPTAHGWIFRAPNPWIFGRPTHYVVNDAQRAQIIAEMTRKQPIALVLGLVTLIGAWIAIFSAARWFGYGFEQPTVLELLFMLTLIVAPVFAAIAINAAAMRKRISAFVASAPETQETITYREMRATAARLQPKRSMRYFVGMGALWVFMGLGQVLQLIGRQARHPFGSDALSYFAVLVLFLAIVLAITHFVQALRSYRDAHRLR
jgi:hypothetical protein